MSYYRSLTTRTFDRKSRTENIAPKQKEKRKEAHVFTPPPNVNNPEIRLAIDLLEHLQLIGILHHLTVNLIVAGLLRHEPLTERRHRWQRIHRNLAADVNYGDRRIVRTDLQLGHVLDLREVQLGRALLGHGHFLLTDRTVQRCAVHFKLVKSNRNQLKGIFFKLSDHFFFFCQNGSTNIV